VSSPIWNLEGIEKVRGMLELFLESSSRTNELQERKYWYPLSAATYGTDEILQALDSMCSFRTTMWEKTAAFEREFAAYTGAASAVMVNSGSSADLLMCFLMTQPGGHRLKPGDEILVPAVTWPTQIWSAMMAGLQVKLVDVDPATLNVDLEDLERSIGPKTKAIFLVHLLGNPCDMDAVRSLAREHGLLILEDCCEALGSTYDGEHVGSFGEAAAYSFFFSHHMTTMEGGAVTCVDEADGDRLKVLRAHGWSRNVGEPTYDISAYPDVDPRYAFVNWGFNVRPTELQAGFGLVQLARLPLFTQRRAELAERFTSYVKGEPWLATPAVADKAVPSWMCLGIRVAGDAPFSARDLTAHLEDAGVETRPLVAGNIARQPVAEIFPEMSARDLPGADEVHGRAFYVGLSPYSDLETMDHLIDVFEQFLHKVRSGAMLAG
jgi:CDP-6-deoxy-D-xylo-4-hexulose-3-dehydrase